MVRITAIVKPEETYVNILNSISCAKLTEADCSMPAMPVEFLDV